MISHFRLRTVCQRALLPCLMLAMVLVFGCAAQASVTGVQVTATGQGGARVLFLASPPVTPLKIFTLPAPDRLVMDIPLTPTTGIALPPDYRGGLIRSVRFGQFNPSTGRVVMELSQPVQLLNHRVEGQGIVLELAPKSGGLAMARPSGSAEAFGAVPARALPMNTPFAVLDKPETEAPQSQAPTAEKTPISQKPMMATAAPAPPPASLPTPAGDGKKPLIILDAGHGGQDPGALGVRKTREKEVTLAMAKAVQSVLLRSGRYRVALTRSDDRYILLPDRVAMARRLKADIFISLHADSNPRPEARGLSIYTLSENASDDEAAALADRENKTDIIGGLDLNVADQDVASILIDLTQRETMNKSTILADTIVRSLHPSVRKLPSTHRFAGFRVLKAPDIPSVLIELGFLSNVEDEKQLTRPAYQQQVAASILKGLDAYRGEKK